jgi:hypothetical protein
LKYFRYWHAKFLLVRPFLSIRSQMSLLVGFPERSGGRVRSYPIQYHHHHGYPSSHITRGMRSRLVSGRDSETSCLIDVINQCSITLSLSNDIFMLTYVENVRVF